MTAAQPSTVKLPWSTRMAIFARLFAIQSAWNYELMLGTGIGFCTEPALRSLPGGPAGLAYHDALARESRFFNAHPYMASLAVGALVRAELDQEPPAQIERFRAALCGPLGSVGDRLVWAGWLPLCSLIALAAFGLGAGPLFVVFLFLVLYNVGHLGLRAWGLREGWRHGLRVANALGNPLLRHGPEFIARAIALLAGVAVPLALRRMLLSSHTIPGRAVVVILVAAAVLAIVLVRLHGRTEGWRVAILLLAALAVYSIAQW